LGARIEALINKNRVYSSQKYTRVTVLPRWYNQHL